MKKIKILFIIDEINIGGTEKQLLSTIERLDKNFFTPYLVCLRSTELFMKCNLHCTKLILGVGSLFSLDGFRKLIGFVQYLRREKISIVQTFFFDSTVFGVLAAKLARVNMTISCRRDMGFWYTPNLLTTLRIINLLTDRILVNSQAIKANVIEKEWVTPDKVNVIYNGIDLKPFSVKNDIEVIKSELKIPLKDKVVGIVANLNRRVKRVNLFISAASDVLKENAHVSFIVVGDGHLREKLEQQANTLGITKKIRFIGLQEDVIPYLQMMDIGVLTSESEGFSNSLIEYVASGLPVICFYSGGNIELIENRVNGFLIRRESELAVKISRLLNSKDELEYIQQNNYEYIQSFNWSNIIKQLEQYYLTIQ